MISQLLLQRSRLYHLLYASRLIPVKVDFTCKTFQMKLVNIVSKHIAFIQTPINTDIIYNTLILIIIVTDLSVKIS